MMKKTLLSVLVLCFLGVNFLAAQGFQKPAEGKAAIYFTRTVSYGSSMLIDIFDGDKYIAYSMGKGYSVYECEPGEHTFWIAAENTDFITADLEAGKVYIAQVYVYPGVMKGRVKLTPNSATDENMNGYNSSVAVINKVVPKVMKQKTFDKRMAKFTKKKFTSIKMAGYEKNIKGVKEIPHISKENSVEDKEFN